MEKDGGGILEQMIKSLEGASDILDEAYRKSDAQKFNSAKKLILQIQNKIPEIIA